PLYDNGKDVLFVQPGGRRHEGRTTLNMGGGVRLFRGQWMYGTNVFFDNDITGHNRRVGIGAEAWTNYLRFSANSYFGMNDWHQSRDFEDYDERPADGFDITTNGWLPSYPQLGAKLKYEQYRGNHVGLLGKETLQKNPKALTLGLEWTPVPLVSLGTDYRNSGGHDEMELQAKFNWRFGESLSDQLSGEKVGFSRTLAGSRLDLVERNNNIVLDYRKQQVVQLTLPDTIRGNGLSTQQINASVSAKHGLASIEWNAPELVGAGGKITSIGTNVLQVQLPEYHYSSTNQYVIHARAKDVRGNYSPSAETTVVVDGAEVSADRSNVAFSLNNLPADGRSASLITLRVQDANGHPVQGIASSIVLPFTFSPFTTAMNNVKSVGGKVWDVLTGSLMSQAMAELPAATASGGVKIGQIKEVQPGVYEANLTAGVVPGTVEVSPRVAGVALSPKSLMLGVNVKSLSPGKIQPPSVNPKADGDPVKVNVPVMTPDGKLAKNLKVSISVNGTIHDTITDENGYAQLSLPGQTTPGDVTDNIVLNGHAESITLHFEDGSVFGPAPAAMNIVADNVASGKLLFTVLDPKGKGKNNEKVHVTVGGQPLSDGVTNNAGEVSVPLSSSSTAGDVNVIVSLDNGASQTVTVHYLALT
ncbi:inverse autotransporter beta domain-containing protein, partial [Buttiauxella noackiae]|uniref:inverse autotransporter beta domain-containing protein n=1 Tax=Buttiauxella noackiae TaxID=82992 RepID=UPI000A87F8FB